MAYLLLLYKDAERLSQLVAHSDGVAVDAETLAHLKMFEVRVQFAVILASNGDEFAVKEPWVTFGYSRWWRLYKGEVRVAVEELFGYYIRVAAQHAQVVLTSLHAFVARKNCFHVATQFGVAFPALAGGR
mgnify:CR=1 FL=1